MKIKNDDLDHFTTYMIHVYGEENQQQEITHSPYFMTRLRVRLRESQRISQLWETSVIRAQHWLVGLSFIALIFFVSNLAVKPTTQYSTTTRLTPEMIASTDFDLDLNEVLLSDEETHKD